MKKLLILLSIPFAILSCTSTDETAGKSVGDLKTQKENLESEMKILAEKIKELDGKIRKEAGDENQRVFKVKTIKLQPEPFIHYFQVQGQVEADKNIVLTAEASGIIRAIHVNEGQKVAAGQKLLSLDTDILDKNIEEAKAAYDLASFVYERQKKLWDQNIGSELEFKQATNNKVSLEARLNSLSSQKNKSVIRAPFSGVIDEIIPKTGELVSQGMRIGRLINLDQLKLDADVSESYVGKVKKGTKVLIKFPAIGEQIESELTQVGNYIEPNNRTIKVSAKLNRNSAALIPNLVAELNVQDYVNENAVVVPAKAILQDLNNKNYVYILKNKGDLKSVERVYVTTGFTYNGNTEIVNGLAGTEEVVVNGARSITEGAIVSVEQ